MQQTETYKLNLIESSDPFLPDALNANTKKVEEALKTGLAGETAARKAENAALDARVTVLEGVKFAAGVYEGDAEIDRVFELGFRPKAVLVSTANDGQNVYFVTDGAKDNLHIRMTDNGMILRSTYSFTPNSVGKKCFFAFG